MDWALFFSTFGVIFLAELGDKTQLAVLTQTCKFRRPGAVFFGAALGLTAVTAVGVAGGSLIARIIPQWVISIVAALAFIIMGILIFREASESKGHEGETCETDSKGSFWKAFSSTFMLLFVAEMGDKTQLAAITLAGQQPNPWPIFIGSSLALTAVAGIGALCGQGLCLLIPQKLLLRISAVGFVIMGILIGFGVF